MSLKSFLLHEELQVSHAERYLTYVDRYHHEVFLDLKKQLEKSWEDVVKKFGKKYQVSAEDKQAAELRNTKATVDIEVVFRPEKLLMRARGPLEVAPSVKIPHLLKPEERELIIKALLEEAHSALYDTTRRWKEIFSHERKGKLEPWFKIDRDHDEIRLQLAESAKNKHAYTTLYAVRIEFGKSGSKLRDFDRVYLTSMI